MNGNCVVSIQATPTTNSGDRLNQNTILEVVLRDRTCRYGAPAPLFHAVGKFCKKKKST